MTCTAFKKAHVARKQLGPSAANARVAELIAQIGDEGSGTSFAQV